VCREQMQGKTRAGGSGPQDRREAILMAALDCFNRHGIEASSIGEIGRLAGASVGSIYHHFSSKEGIAIALLAEGLRNHVRQLEARLRKPGAAQQGVRTVVRCLIDWVAANPEWAGYIYNVSSTRLMQAGQAQLQEVNDYYAAVMDAYFGPHLKAGAFRKLPKDCLPSLMLGPVHDYARRWLNGQVSSNIVEHAEVFAAAAWNNLRAI
ncbi:MAG TPA: TetR/AcrR family transcriptional regulator, partial [Nevskia sp.]|nr:TetR/AcrR family transcriptional regulator [Nevskia sp.]